MRIKEKDKRILEDLKNADPFKVKKIMNKIPTRLLIKFFINMCSKEQLEMLYNEYEATNQSRKIELLIKGYKKKYRINPSFVSEKYL